MLQGSKRAGRLNLVDLAGSEKVGKTGAKGQTLEEAEKWMGPYLGYDNHA